VIVKTREKVRVEGEVRGWTYFQGKTFATPGKKEKRNSKRKGTVFNGILKRKIRRSRGEKVSLKEKGQPGKYQVKKGGGFIKRGLEKKKRDHTQKDQRRKKN